MRFPDKKKRNHTTKSKFRIRHKIKYFPIKQNNGRSRGDEAKPKPQKRTGKKPDPKEEKREIIYNLRSRNLANQDVKKPPAEKKTQKKCLFFFGSTSRDRGGGNGGPGEGGDKGVSIAAPKSSIRTKKKTLDRGRVANKNQETLGREKPQNKSPFFRQHERRDQGGDNGGGGGGGGGDGPLIRCCEAADSNETTARNP